MSLQDFFNNHIRFPLGIPMIATTGNLKFYCPTALEKWRVDTLYTKEPETIAWIDSFKPSSVLWDIGANVGMYSIYAAKKGHFVVSFEPSSREYEILKKNIELNMVWGDARNLFLNDKTDYSKFPLPDYIKIDTDGSDLKILTGIADTIQVINNVKGILIELDGECDDTVMELMQRNNLSLKYKGHAKMFDGTKYEKYNNAIFEHC